ncbi:hypothetical protein GGH17_001970 [Coemansia sp. RSA 788]|nr:hypothetical protein GGH17_001970 [Coemansia sp. RSA 788]KAJ2280731.1 hypothetical protein GGH14_002255 [Coemansia sp. RSA 370]
MAPHVGKIDVMFDEQSSASGSRSRYTLEDSEPTVGQRSPNLKRSYSTASSNNSSDVSGESDNIEECIASMVVRRDQLRKRFKEWAEDVDKSAMRLRCITDNALVNQSMRLEKILGDGKARIDTIVGDQNRIREQLSSFVSMLSSAQAQIFGDSSVGLSKSEFPTTSVPVVKPAAKLPLTDKRQSNT